MRISAHERQAIVDSILSLDANAEVFLFGSRVHDHLRGGDIDLLILSQSLTEGDKIRIYHKICDDIGEQKIDILISPNENSPFVRKAKKTGVKLNE